MHTDTLHKLQSLDTNIAGVARMVNRDYMKMAGISRGHQFFLLACLLLMSLPVYLGSRMLFSGQKWEITITEGLCLITILCAAAVCYDISSMEPSHHMGYSQLFTIYLVFKLVHVAGYWSARKHEAATRDPEKAQLELLLRQLRRSKDTEFGRDHGFGEIRSVEEYRKKVPITDYSYYTNYTEKTVRGEKDILVPGSADYLILTSGTTGNNKKYPFTKAAFRGFLLNCLCLVMYRSKILFPTRFHIRKMISIIVPGRVVTNEAGIRMGPITSYVKPKSVPCTTPPVGWEDCDETVIMYLHALFGLLHEDTTEIFLNFVALARSFFITLENNWESIVEDIRTGTLSLDLDLPQDLRQRLQQELWADPRRAAEVEREFKKGFDNIVPRLWPNVTNIVLACSGTLQTPSLNLQRKYFPKVPVVSSWHGASEGEFGMCFEPGKIETAYYILMPHYVFYEFIPLEEMARNDPSVKLLEEVEVGRQYEICVTNVARGIFRYRIGDIIKIISWYNKTPVYEFIGRYGQLLNICGEKTSENTFHQALEETLARLDGVAMVDYTTAENRYLDDIQGTDGGRYYLLFIELETRDSGGTSLTESQKQMFDEVLQSQNENYGELRSIDRIQQMKVMECKPGTFHRLKEYVLSCNARTSSMQYKTPKVLRTEGQLQVMLENACGQTLPEL